jgi:hypothetical protein
MNLDATFQRILPIGFAVVLRLMSRGLERDQKLARYDTLKKTARVVAA